MISVGHSGGFVPFTPLKAHSNVTPRRKASTSIHSVPVPRANCPPLLQPSREQRQRPTNMHMKFEEWLEEHNRWKEMQRIGILQSHFPMMEEQGTRDEGGEAQTLSYVRLSLSPLQTPSLSTRKSSVPGPPQFPHSCRMRKLQQSDFTKSTCDSTPRGRFLKKSPDESVYEDPQTHRIFARVKVPGLTKPPSAISSKRSTATRFFSRGSDRCRPKTGGVLRLKQQRIPLNQIVAGAVESNKTERPLVPESDGEKKKDCRQSPARQPGEEKYSPSLWSSENTPMLESRYMRKSIEAAEKPSEADLTLSSEPVVN